MRSKTNRTLNRRRFVEGLAIVGGAAAVGLRLGPARAADRLMRSGARCDLAIGALPVNITGRQRMATVVNGSLPGPTLRFREGDAVTINVRNTLAAPTSIHWHGILLPNAMDGVPGLTFKGIMPGATFTYRFPLVQSGTYWYHSHSAMQEQTGLYGPLIIEPRNQEPYAFDRDYVVMLSDWTDEDPMTVAANLKQQSDYYNYARPTLGTFIADAGRDGLRAALRERLMWSRMRMSPADIMDVGGSTYTFLVNGRPPAANWTALFEPGERIRLRFINASSMTTFDVRIPGLAMTVVQADGSNVEPVEVDEFRIGVAETYDVIVNMGPEPAYSIFAQAEDRSGYARATLAIRDGLQGPIPPMDPRPVRTMADMGMGDMKGMPDMASMTGAQDTSADIPTSNADGVDPASLRGQASVDNVSMMPMNRLAEAGDGLDGNGRRNLTYADLRSATADVDRSPPTRAIEFHLTGNMERFVWGFDGKAFAEAPPVHIGLGERVRFILINDTMMEHPIHLHGYLFELENGRGDRLPLKHTVNVKPSEKLSFVFTADAPGYWAFHCHLMFHMENGMFRTVIVS